MRPASVTMFSGMLAKYMMATEINVLSGMVMAATMAERSGKSTIMTRMMTAIDSKRSRRKSRMLSPTTFGWSAIRVRVTSSGSSPARKSSSTLSTSRP